MWRHAVAKAIGAWLRSETSQRRRSIGGEVTARCPCEHASALADAAIILTEHSDSRADKPIGRYTKRAVPGNDLVTIMCSGTRHQDDSRKRATTLKAELSVPARVTPVPGTVMDTASSA